MLLWLLRSVRGQGFGYSPPPPNTPPPPSAFECTFTPNPSQPDIYYDLTLAEQALKTDIVLDVKNAQGGSSGKIYTRICRPPKQYGGSCPSSSCSSPPCVSEAAAVDLFVDTGQGSCAATGALNTGQWYEQTPGDPKGGAKIVFTGGDPAGGNKRQMTMVFQCNWHLDHPQGVSATEDPPLTYEVVIATSGACALAPGPLSWGWITLILFLVVVVVYFGGGGLYNYKVCDHTPPLCTLAARRPEPIEPCASACDCARCRASSVRQYRGEEGLSIIPQWSSWSKLPGLVMDGCAFSWKHGSHAVRSAPRDLREWYNGRNTKELREPIAYSAATE